MSRRDAPREREVTILPDPTGDELVANLPLYKLAFDEAKRSLDDQESELSNIRQRSVQFLAFTGGATAFLVGATLKVAHRTGGFHLLAFAAMAVGLASVLLCVWLLAPWTVKDWESQIDAKLIIGDWIEREVPSPPGEGRMLRDLALMYDDARRNNEGLLGRLRVMYLSSVGTGGVQIVLWAMIAWIWA